MHIYIDLEHDNFVLLNYFCTFKAGTKRSIIVAQHWLHLLVNQLQLDKSLIFVKHLAQKRMTCNRCWIVRPLSGYREQAMLAAAVEP